MVMDYAVTQSRDGLYLLRLKWSDKLFQLFLKKVEKKDSIYVNDCL